MGLGMSSATVYSAPSASEEIANSSSIQPNISPRFYQNSEFKSSFSWFLPILIILITHYSPLFFPHKLVDVSHLGLHYLSEPESLHYQFYISCSAVIAIATPLIIDFVLDQVTKNFRAVDSTERLIVGISLIIPCSINLWFPPSSLKVYVSYFSMAGFFIIRIYAQLSVAFRINPDILNKKLVYLLLSMYSLSVLFTMYNISFGINIPGEFIDFLFYTSLIGCFFMCLQYFYRMYFVIRSSNHTQRMIHLIACAHVVTPFALFFTTYPLRLAYNIELWANGTPAFGVVYNIVDAFITITLIMIPARFAIMQGIESQNTLDIKRTFVRYVSHEIRSPLNVVSAGLDIMENQLDPNVAPKEAIDLLKDVRFATSTAIDILNELLNYEKMDAGLFNLSLEFMSISGLFEKSLSSYTTLAKSKDITFKINDMCGVFSSDIAQTQHAAKVFVNVDFKNIEIVLRNLLTNAIKFTPTGGHVTVNVSVEDDLPHSIKNIHRDKIIPIPDFSHVGFMKVEVVDDGAGIQLENIGKLFNEFVQFDRNKLQAGGGSGLGLWISRAIILQHHGHISAMSSGLGKGSTFVFIIPVYERSDGSLKAEIKSNANDGFFSSSAKSNKQIGLPIYQTVDSTSQKRDQVSINVHEAPNKVLRFVIADDSKINRKIMCKMLDNEFKIIAPSTTLICLEAEDGDLAVDLIAKNMEHGNQIHCVLIDNTMVKMNGPEAVEALRHDLHFSGIIIGVTGNALSEDMLNFRCSGCNEVFAKPVKGQDIMALLRELGLI